MAFQIRGSSKQIRDYIIKERIGVGTYGMIYKVLTKNSKQIYVLKQIPFISSESKTEIEEVKNEASILSQLNSRFVVRYYDSFEENNCLNIVMEFCEGGDLCSYLEVMKKNIKTLNENQIWKFFIQLSLGLDYIHKRKILHRDLKTMNIFLTKDLDIKIGDLGVAKRLLNTAHAHTFIGTPFYLSPEICEEKPYNEKSDVWALGCILYEMTTFKHPYNATNQAALFIKILNGTYEPIVSKYSKELKKMIDMLLEKDHFKRPSIRQIIETPLFLSKAKSLGMLDIVIDALNIINPNNNKIKMIKISSIHKVKDDSKNKIKKRKSQNSLKGSRLCLSEHENNNSNCQKDSSKCVLKKKTFNGSDQIVQKQTPKVDKKKLALPTHANGNSQPKNNPIQLKKPIASVFHFESGIMKKLNQISNDYFKQKEADINNAVFSNRKKEQAKSSFEKLTQQSNSKNKYLSDYAQEETKQSVNCKSNKVNQRKKRQILHLNSVSSKGSSNLLNQAKKNQKNHIKEVKSTKTPSSDIYKFAQELDKKTLKLASIETIKKSKTNDKIKRIPLFKDNDDQCSFKVVEAYSKDIQNFDDCSIENIEINNCTNEYFAENSSDAAEEEDETVSIIRSNDYIEKQESDLIKEHDERMRSIEQFKNKYTYYQNGILKYSNQINCDYFFNLYKQLENNENIDEKTNKIIDYIHKTIPEKEAEFIQLFHNYIVYEVKLRESEKEMKEWKTIK